MTDSTHSIFHSAKRFFSGTMLSRVSGMMRDMSMAYGFGTQEAVAAFMVAFRFSHLLRRLFGEGALQSAFIPHFEGIRKHDPNDAARFFKELTRTLTAWLTLIIIISMTICGACLLWLDLSPGNREILYLTILMLPSLLFICLFGLNTSLLQCEHTYFIPGVAPVAFNFVWIIGVLFLWQMPTSAAMPWLAGVVIIACVCQWAMTVPSTLAVLRNFHVENETFSLFSAHIRKFLKPLFLGIIGVAASQINNAMDSIFARYADLEGPALLWYALRLQQLPLALFGIAIAGALLPPLTRALKRDDLPTYHHFLDFAMRRSIALMLPITAAIFVMGDSSINLIYAHGDFTDSSTLGTTRCLWAYSIGLVPMTLVLIYAPAFYARNDYRTPTIAATVCMMLNIVLNAFLIMVLGFGAASVAIATSISAFVNCIQLAVMLRGDLKLIMNRNYMIDFGKVLLATMAASLAVVAIGSNFWPILQGSIVEFPHAASSQFIRLAWQTVVFIATLAVVAKCVKAHDLTGLLRSPKKELKI